MTLIHLHLRNPITVNGKHTYDVQFYREVSQSEAELNNKMEDDDKAMELEEREMERLDTNKKEFLGWCMASEDVIKKTDDAFAFDVPSAKVCFDGNVGPNQ